MATAYTAPGVYVEETPLFPPAVAPVETAIPAFIGYTEFARDKVDNDLLLKPTRISSMVEYERHFGLPQMEEKITVAVTSRAASGDRKAVASLEESDRSRHIMHYALQMFYANGGKACYIVSVNGYKSPFGAALVESELHAGLDAVRSEDEPTLIVFPEAQGLSIADFKTLHDAALAQCAELKDRFTVMDVHGDAESMSDPHADLPAAIADFRARGIGTDHLKYGAAYAPNIATALDFRVDESRTQVTITTDGITAQPVTLDSLKADGSPFHAWAISAIRDLPCRLPPSSAMAGIYAAEDGNRGVWKAPANVSIKALIEPAIPIDGNQNDLMKVDAGGGKSVNAIRSFAGKGTLVWGARTLAGNDSEWRYISVRRFVCFVEKSVRKALMHCIFESNDANTWVRVQGMIENFLTMLWRDGALQGSTPQHAFRVSVGLGKTMTPLDILEGRMIVEVGMAVVRPAEFTFVRFFQEMPGP